MKLHSHTHRTPTALVLGYSLTYTYHMYRIIDAFTNVNGKETYLITIILTYNFLTMP